MTQPLQICIGPSIRIGRESWCLPYAGFFLEQPILLDVFLQTCLKSNEVRGSQEVGGGWEEPGGRRSSGPSRERCPCLCQLPEGSLKAALHLLGLQPTVHCGLDRVIVGQKSLGSDWMPFFCVETESELFYKKS